MWALVLLVAAVPTRLFVVVDVELPCPLAPELELAVSRALPGLPRERGDHELHVRSGLDGLSVELRAPDGRPVLTRTLALDAPSCPALADTIALIVERYLSDLGYAPARVTLPTPTAPTPLDLELGLAGHLAVPSLDGPSLGAGLSLGLSWRWLRANVEASYGRPLAAPVFRDAVEIGAVEATTVGLLAGAGACARWLLDQPSCLFVRLGAERWSLAPTGEIYQRVPLDLWLFTGQLGLAQELWWGPVGLRLEARARARPPRTLRIEDASPETFSLPAVDLSVGLGVAFAFALLAE